MGKGRRERGCPFGDKTTLALDRYLRLGRTHRLAASDWLWLARKGGLSGSGLGQMLQRRGRAAGLGSVHPHELRHTFAHAWLAAGGTEGDLMRLAGWRSRQRAELAHAREVRRCGQPRAPNASRMLLAPLGSSLVCRSGRAARRRRGEPGCVDHGHDPEAGHVNGLLGRLRRVSVPHYWWAGTAASDSSG